MESIYIQTFLNFPQIIRSIFKIVQNCKRMSVLLNRIDMGESLYELEGEFNLLKKSFDDNLGRFIRLLNRMNQIGSSQYLSQLIIRLNFNNYYEMLTCDMQLENI